MSLFESLFGKKLHGPELRVQAAAALQEIEKGSPLSPDAVLKSLRKKQKPFYAFWRMGGEMHAEFRRVAQAALDRLAPVEILPAHEVAVVPWETWETPTVGDVLRKAFGAEATALLLSAPEKRSHKNALAELEALRVLANPDVVMVMIDEEDLLVDCAFLRALEGRIDPETEEVGQDLADAAKALGYTVQAVW